MSRRKTPYDHLLARFECFRRRVELPRRREMFVLPKDELRPENGDNFFDVAERTRAADKLGWDVRLRWDDSRGLVIEYVERAVVPWLSS